MIPGAPAIAKYRRKYGLIWPLETPDHQIELYLAKKWREPEFAHADFISPRSEHMLRALRLLFTPKQLVIHPWFEDMANSWVEDAFTIWWGPAACGKSHAMGILGLVDFLTDPMDTYTVLASTTVPMLELRSFASVVEYLGHLKANARLHVPFKFIRARMVVAPDTADENTDVRSLRAIIKGVAVKQGSEEDARAALQGVHLPYVRQIGDELEGMRPAFAAARFNLAQCEKDFKFVAACNPESLTGEAGKLSIPAAPGGWATIDPDTSTGWKSELGTVLRFDALKSPGIAEPGKYPFLPTQKKIDLLIHQNKGNMDAPAVWTFLRAFPAPNALERTVLSQADVVSQQMDQPPVWLNSFQTVAGIDPAFTSDGDNAIFQIGYVGYLSTGQLALAFGPTEYLKILASSKVPVLEQLVAQSSDLMDQHGVPIERIAVDDSGTQSVADALEMRRGVGLQRFNFSANPPDLPVSTVNFESAAKRYKNTVTWLWFTLAEYGRFGQIRALPAPAQQQFCQRRMLPKLRPSCLESKKDLKKRTAGASPDEGDACALVAGLARLRLGMMPGATELSAGPVIGAGYVQEDAGFEAVARKFNNLQSSYSSSAI